MVTCSDRFRLSPHVQLLQPLDELKRSKFSLQVAVTEYRSVSGGVEVVLNLGAKSLQQGELVWTSTLTLLSPKAAHTHTLQLDAQAAEERCVRCVGVAVPCWAGGRCVWLRSVPLEPFFSMLVSVLVYGCPAALWPVSRCLAETEKLKGADAVKAPLSLTVRYTHPLSLPSVANIRIREAPVAMDTQTCRNYVLDMVEQTTGELLLTGEMERLEQGVVGWRD